MKKTAAIFILLIVIGFFVGRLVGGFSRAGSLAAGESAQPHGKQTSGDTPSISSNESLQIPRIVTSESLETITAQAEDVAYASLALWLLDADAGEIAEYWQRIASSQPTTDEKRLLFFNWMRVNPLGAIAATAGGEDASLAWWAWAASDPAQAMAAAGTDEQKKRVAKGIGEFQPGWLRDHFSELPEEVKNDALAGLSTWKETDDPAGMLDLFLENDRGFQSHIFKAFALKDPWKAFDWLEKNNMLQPTRYSNYSGGVEVLIEQMKKAHPDDLERMAVTMPYGKLKRMMEDAAFEGLIASDPAKALKSAKETEAPLMAAKRLGIIGSGLLSTDPDKAFDIAAEILAKNSGGLSPEVTVRSETSNRSWGGQEGDASKFFNSLIAKDPARTLDMAVTAADGAPGNTFNELIGIWAVSDLEGYVGWVKPTDRSSGAGGCDQHHREAIATT